MIMLRKRIVAVFLCALLVMGMLPAQALAAQTESETTAKQGVASGVIINPLYQDVITEADLTPMPAAYQTVSTYSGSEYLTDLDEAAEILREGMKDRETSIHFMFKTSGDPAEVPEKAFDMAMAHTGVPTEGDYLMWQYGGAGWRYSYYCDSNGIWYMDITFTITYLSDAEQEAEMDTAVKKLLNQLDLWDASDYEKVLGIYDYICDNVTYDYENLEDDSYDLKYTAYAALVNGTSVCQGYAVLFYRLALSLDVDCRVVTGTSFGTGHAWNIVELDGKYYNLDSTWDAGSTVYYYFLRGDDNFPDHNRDYSWENSGYPISKTDYVPGDTMKVPTVKVTNVASTGKMKLSWNKVSGAAKYEVYRATSKTGTYKHLKTTTNTSLVNTTAEAGKTYYYKVRAVSEDGTKTKFSSVVYRTCDLARPTVTMSNVASSGKIKLSWTKIEGASGYEVYRATSKDGTYQLLKTVTGTSLTNTSTTAGKTYYYKVRAIHSKSSANSAYSEIKSRTCDLPQPEIKLTNVASSGKIKLSWAKVEGASGYEIYRATSKDGTYKLLKTVTGTSFTNTGAVAGKTYYYKVRAIHSKSSANSAYSEMKSRTCDLPRPTLTVKLNSKGKPLLNWDDISGAVQYKVYIYNSKGSLVDTVTTETSKLTHSGAAEGKTYTYRVAAWASKSAANSAKSAEVSIKSK